MTRKILLVILLLPVLGLMAQIPFWTIHPEYTSIKIIGNGLYARSQLSYSDSGSFNKRRPV